MASKRRFKGCSSVDVRKEKEPHIEAEDFKEAVVIGLSEVVFSQYELLRRICEHLPTRDLLSASLGEIFN